MIIFISERTVQLGDDVKTLQYQADRSRKDNDVRINQVEEKKLKIKTMETKLSKIQKDKRNIEEQIQFAAKGKIDIFLVKKNSYGKNSSSLTRNRL